MSDKRRKELHDFANELETFTAAWDVHFKYRHAAEELRSLAHGRDQHKAPPGWLEDPGEAHRMPVSQTSNPYFGHLPEVSWRLLVKFKR